MRDPGRLAQATLPASKTPWQDYADDYDRIRDTMARALEGSKNSTRARRPHGFRLAQPARDRVFQTAFGPGRVLAALLPTTSTRARAG